MAIGQLILLALIIFINYNNLLKGFTVAKCDLQRM